jgi:hypothetical protein
MLESTRPMNRVRAALVVVLILVWGLFVPVAMAADHCAAMNYMCEGPCGASAPATAPTVRTVIGFVSLVRSAPVPAVPQIDRPALEPPPKPLVLSA